MSCFTATSRCVLSHKDISGTLTTTRSHRLRVAHSLDLEAWTICMLRCNVTSRRQFSHLSCRYLTNNQITSIASGAFSGLGSLTELYVTILCHITAYFFFRTACAGTWPKTRSHRLIAVHLLGLEASLICMLPSALLLFTKPHAYCTQVAGYTPRHEGPIQHVVRNSAD